MKYTELLTLNEGIDYHLSKKLPFHESIFRMGSDEYFKMFRDARKLYGEGKLKDLHPYDEEILRDTLLGEWEQTRQGLLPLDMIIDEQNHLKHLGEPTNEFTEHECGPGQYWCNESGQCKPIPPGHTVDDSGWLVKEAEYRGKKVSLNKPKRGGTKKFYVYTKNKKGNIVKVSFGADSGGGKLAVKLKDPKARKAFADRHNCDQKNDKTKAGYWSCRLPRYAKSLGLSGGGTWW
tara:strand:+ start:840 stop:1541 length:702 start_codon:yes stop_codon:yes gene_type:complete